MLTKKNKLFWWFAILGGALFILAIYLVAEDVSDFGEAFFLPIILIGTAVLVKVTKNNDDNKAKQKIIEATKEQERLLEEVNEIYNSSTIYNKYPQKYTYIEAAQSIIEYFVNMRADTLKEGLNLYETDLHNARVIEIQEGMRIASENASSAARGAQNAAIFAAVMSGISTISTIGNRN